MASESELKKQAGESQSSPTGASSGLGKASLLAGVLLVLLVAAAALLTGGEEATSPFDEASSTADPEDFTERNDRAGEILADGSVVVDPSSPQWPMSVRPSLLPGPLQESGGVWFDPSTSTDDEIFGARWSGIAVSSDSDDAALVALQWTFPAGSFDDSIALGVPLPGAWIAPFSPSHRSWVEAEPRENEPRAIGDVDVLVTMTLEEHRGTEVDGFDARGLIFDTPYCVAQQRTNPHGYEVVLRDAAVRGDEEAAGCEFTGGREEVASAAVAWTEAERLYAVTIQVRACSPGACLDLEQGTSIHSTNPPLRSSESALLDALLGVIELWSHSG